MGKVLEKSRTVFLLIFLGCVFALGMVFAAKLFWEFRMAHYLLPIGYTMVGSLVAAYLVGWWLQRNETGEYTVEDIEVGVLRISSGRLQIGHSLTARYLAEVTIDVPQGEYAVRARARRYNTYTLCEQAVVADVSAREVVRRQRKRIEVEGGPLIFTDGTVTKEAARAEPLRGLIAAAFKRNMEREKWGMIADEQGRNFLAWVDAAFGDEDYPVEIARDGESRAVVTIRFLKEGQKISPDDRRRDVDAPRSTE